MIKEQAGLWNTSPEAAERTRLLNEKLVQARAVAPLLTNWKHKKGGIYRIIGHAIDSDNGEVRVRYDRVGGPGFNRMEEADIEFVRPVSEWTADRFTQITR